MGIPPRLRSYITSMYGTVWWTDGDSNPRLHFAKAALYQMSYQPLNEIALYTAFSPAINPSYPLFLIIRSAK